MNEDNTSGRCSGTHRRWWSGGSTGASDDHALTRAMKTFVTITAIIFACEAVVMVILHVFGMRGIWDIVMDPIMLALLSTPLLYGLVARPLQNALEQRERAQDKLRASEERYRGIVDNISIGVALISPDMKIVELNKTMRRWFPDIDATGEPVCYRSFSDPPRDEPCSYCPTIKTLADGEVHEDRTETPTPDGMRNYRVVASPIKSADGQVVAAIEMVEDITERTRVEQYRLENNEHLERFNRLAVGRELKMAQLKQEINGLLEELGREWKYEIVSAGQAEVHT